MYKKTLFIFRRDLRLEDNVGLSFALKHSKEVVCCFIFTPEQIEHNPYLSLSCLQFMLESLEELKEELQKKQGKLYLFLGPPHKVVEKCIELLHIDAVVCNQDYTPYSLSRDQKIQSACEKKKINFVCHEDVLLHPVTSVRKKEGTPYSMFTPYFKKAFQLEVLQPKSCPVGKFFSGPISFAHSSELFEKILPQRRELLVKGGRKEGLNQLKEVSSFKFYEKERNYPSLRTTQLSSYLKFTVLSPREVYHKISKTLGVSHPLIRSLYWRDFFTSIGFHFPYVLSGAFHQKYDTLTWNQDLSLFKKWCEGLTGFPIVDAGMRQMNETGFMHNRVRMVAASFLCKQLHINWRWGEKYFAQTLIDYDPLVNNGNWQWCASTGCDAQPYFRIFNPWLQQKKFDPDCLYIKTWLPELQNILPGQIHKLYQDPIKGYPLPLVDASKEAAKALNLYRKAAKN